MSCPARAPARGAGPRTKGHRLPSPAALAGSTSFAPVTVRRYGKTATVQAAVITCLWHGVFGTRTVQVVLIRDRNQTGSARRRSALCLPAETHLDAGTGMHAMRGERWLGGARIMPTP